MITPQRVGLGFSHAGQYCGDKGSWTHEEATMGRGQEGNAVGYPCPLRDYL